MIHHFIHYLLITRQFSSLQTANYHEFSVTRRETKRRLKFVEAEWLIMRRVLTLCGESWLHAEALDNSGLLNNVYAVVRLQCEPTRIQLWTREWEKSDRKLLFMMPADWRLGLNNGNLHFFDVLHKAYLNVAQLAIHERSDDWWRSFCFYFFRWWKRSFAL